MSSGLCILSLRQLYLVLGGTMVQYSQGFHSKVTLLGPKQFHKCDKFAPSWELASQKCIEYYSNFYFFPVNHRWQRVSEKTWEMFIQYQQQQQQVSHIIYFSTTEHWLVAPSYFSKSNKQSSSLVHKSYNICCSTVSRFCPSLSHWGAKIRTDSKIPLCEIEFYLLSGLLADWLNDFKWRCYSIEW